MINITIHRGANQIGGCITEIATTKAKIIIDLGSNLPGNRVKELTVEQVTQITADADAIFYTHYHGDHIGLFHLVPNDIPQYVGKGALEVIKCKYDTLSKHIDTKEEQNTINHMRTYFANEPIQIKDIRITPYFCSHSAFDAYMFKIETEGKVILHTGDFRNHGYLGKGLDRILKYYIGQIDLLITEGTMLGRTQEKVLHEMDILSNTIKVLKRHKYVYALCSSTDLERLASFKEACKLTHRVFCCDHFLSSILDIFTKYTKSSIFNFSNKFLLNQYNEPKVREFLMKRGFLIPVRSSQIERIKKLIKTYNDAPPYLIYSMWQGYHNGQEEHLNPQIIAMRELFNGRIYDGTRDGFHTSGHADIKTLRDVCIRTNPHTGIIFIHKDFNSSIEALHLPTRIHLIRANTIRDNFAIRIY